MMVNDIIIPKQNREWLRQFRKLQGYTLFQVARLCGISHVVYMDMESGGRENARRCTMRTLKAVSEALGIKPDVFYHRTDEQGRLIDKSSVTDVFALFSANGFRAAIYNEDMLYKIFVPELAEYIIENIVVEYRLEGFTI